MKIYLAALILISICIKTNAQNDKTVKVIGFGVGETKNEALNSSLRYCLEKTFGSYITRKH